MAKYSKADSRRMYSWWWDSHISPKNSKWLEENLKGMDSKVKSMIKLIEEDADSFARRAEMYYKKRPELMKMVEEFYRAYRSLAERYDHATRVIRHAHLTMAEAFPNQVSSSMVSDDSPRSSVSGNDSTFSDHSTLVGEFIDESDSVSRRKSLTQFSFEEVEEMENLNGDSEAIIDMKEAITKLEAEKEAGLTQYKQSLDKLSQLETEMAQSKEDFRVLYDHAKIAEGEIIVLNAKLSEAEAEKELNLYNYKQSVEKITKLQEDAVKLNESAEIEAQLLKGEIEKLSSEKEVALNQYIELLEKISNLESKLQFVEEDSRILKERAEKSETEVEVLRETITILNEEKVAAAQKYQKCLDKISGLEEKLIVEITSRDEKLNDAREQLFLLEKSNHSISNELEALMLANSQELTEKQKEIETLCASIREERHRFFEAEAAFEALHLKTQKELQSISSDLQQRDKSLQIMKAEKNTLQDEVLVIKKENAYFESSVKELKNENAGLRENWQREISEKSALLQKLGILDKLLEKNSVLEVFISDLHCQLEAAGSKIEKLEETLQSFINEKSSVLEEKVKLAVKLKETSEYLKRISDNNTVLEKSLSVAHHQLEALKERSMNMESSCLLLVNENKDLKIENDRLNSLLSSILMKLENLGKLYGEEEKKCCDLVEEKRLYIGNGEELQLCFEMEIFVLSMLIHDLMESERRKEAILCTIQESLQILQGENLKLHGEKRSLMNEIRGLHEKNGFLEQNNSVLFDKVLDLENLYMVLRTFSSEIVSDLREMNTATEEKLEESKIENLRLEVNLWKTKEELKDFITLNNKSNDENEALLVRLQNCMISQFLYEQKWNELQEVCLSYMDQNEDLKMELGTFSSEIELFKDCVLSLENQTGSTHEKLEDPKKDTTQITLLELHDLRARLGSALKAAEEKNDHMVRENADLHSQLDNSNNQLELLQNEVQIWRMMRPKSKISEAGDTLLTKDIVLDQVSDCSSYRLKDKEIAAENQTVKPLKNLDSDSSISTKKFQDLSEPNQEVKKMNISERLESDMEKLVNLQMKVRGLMRKLNVTEKRRRDIKGVVECESIKEKLEEADKAILKLFALNERLMKNSNRGCCLDMKSFSIFEVEDGVVKMKTVSQQARKISDKIGSLQIEVKRLESVVANLTDDEKIGKGKIYRERRVLLRDYLYGTGERTENPQTQAQFCACFQP